MLGFIFQWSELALGRSHDRLLVKPAPVGPVNYGLLTACTGDLQPPEGTRTPASSLQTNPAERVQQESNSVHLLTQVLQWSTSSLCLSEVQAEVLPHCVCLKYRLKYFSEYWSLLKYWSLHSTSQMRNNLCCCSRSRVTADESHLNSDVLTEQPLFQPVGPLNECWDVLDT